MKRCIRTFRGCHTALAILLVSGWLLTAQALTDVPMTLEALVASSQEIVHGTVVSLDSHWNDSHTLIVTDVRIRVQQAITGDFGQELVFEHPGGVVGALRVEIPGSGSFRPEQESILFLQSASNGKKRLTGLSQGRFDIERDSRGHQVVTWYVAGSRDETGAPRSAAGSSGPSKTEELAAFVERIRVVARTLESERETTR